MSTIFEKNGVNFVRPDEVSQLLGINYSQVSRFSHDYPNLMGKVKDPDDGRKSGYSLPDIVKFLVRLDSGFRPSSIFEDRDLMQGDEPILSDIKPLVSTSQYDQVLRIVTGQSPSSSEDGDGIPVVGVDVINVREGVATIVARDPDLDITESEFHRQQEYVEDQCWGYFDETDEECTKHCRLSSACAEARNKILTRLAEQEEKKDAKALKFNDMESKMKNVKKMRDNVMGTDLEEWVK